MYYTNLFFGKDQLTDLRLEDILAHFNTQRTESDKIEYKSYPPFPDKRDTHDHREKAVLKTICALLNSEGGMLVWGAPKSTKDEVSGESFVHGELQPVPKKYEKDAFIAKIANRLTPSPRNVLFHRIETNGNYLYIFDVSPSEHSPHQFEDIYYMRLDGQTHTAPHAYIEALFKKIKYPDIQGYLTALSYYQEIEDCRLDYQIVFRNNTPLMNDENLYCQVRSSIGILHPREEGTFVGEANYKNIAEVISYGQYVYQYFSIEISKSILQQHDNQFELFLTFGGRYSPVRLCSYIIFLRSGLRNARDSIHPLSENIYIHEITNMGRKNETHQDFLIRIGRNPSSSSVPPS